ncbi:RNA cytidine acetyltransferase 1 isoform X1, partial [Tanacetum coccineum]
MNTKNCPQVELLVIDEGAAIPLPVVKSLIRPYLVFLSSTVNVYEGIGEWMKLLMRQQLQRIISVDVDDTSHVQTTDGSELQFPNDR